MPVDQSERSDLNTGYEIFIGALSVLSLVNVLLEFLFRNDATHSVVHLLDIPVSIVFLLDFLVRLRRAPSRSRYFFREFGWADLLASLPFVEVKVLRVFRVIRVVRMLRRYGPGTIGARLLRDRAGSALFSLLFIAILVLEFGSLAILRVESTAPGRNIATAQDAIWYVVATMSTVGYGDRYPVTEAGRLLATVVIVVGVGIFGTLTDYLANAFLTAKEQQPPPLVPADAARIIQRLRVSLDHQRSELADLELLLRQQGPR